MDCAFCPACGVHVPVRRVTDGSADFTDLRPSCSICGFRFDELRPLAESVLFDQVALAEDMDTVRTIVRDDLLAHGLASKVDEFTDGAPFIQVLQARAEQGLFYDLVILDLNMPTLDGLKAAHYLRSVERKHGRLPAPILFFSAVLCDGRLYEQIEALLPSLYLNKGNIRQRQELPDRLRAVLGALKRHVAPL
jgi:CheY-like chemotaxis protein